MQTIEAHLTRALATLREVIQLLENGVEKKQFEERFQGRYVSPGISVRTHIEMLRLGNSLDETPTTMKLKLHRT